MVWCIVYGTLAKRNQGPTFSFLVRAKPGRWRQKPNANGQERICLEFREAILNSKQRPCLLRARFT